MTERADLLARALADHRWGWSLGSFGAVAEFMWDEGEECVVAEPFTRATARGAIHLSRPDLIVPFAYETSSAHPDRWHHHLALCLTEDDAPVPRRTVLTELGPDRDAIRAEDRGAILFDLGLDLPQTEYCVRTDNPAVIAVLRKHLGTRILDPDSPVLGITIKTHPHRVAITAAGRCEVFQKIGGPDTGGVSPQGPHTHLLPTLLKQNRTHSANTPIPAGLVPFGNLQPPSAIFDQLGKPKPFDRVDFDGFQTLLDLYGAADLRDAKRDAAGMVAGNDPSDESEDDTSEDRGRFQRAARRVGTRQARALAGQGAGHWPPAT